VAAPNIPRHSARQIKEKRPCTDICAMSVWIFWALFLAWQAVPAIVIWPARATGLLSIAGVIAAAALVALGTGAAWYIAYTDSSSTASAILIFSPLYLLAAVLVVSGADIGIRTTARVFRHG